MDIFKILNAIYEKTDLPEEIDNSSLIIINKYLSLNYNAIRELKKVIKYHLFIDPNNYLKLLYFNISRQKPPFLRLPKKKKESEDKVYKKISYILDWSDNELEKSRKLIDRVVDFKSLKKEIGSL